MWDLSQNDGSTANVLMHIIIYSTVYGKKNVFVFVSVALDVTHILLSTLQDEAFFFPDFILPKKSLSESTLT